MTTYQYRRNDSVDYAINWALKRNPDYYDFSDLGGDCTNFVSQCIFSGTGIMNFSKTDGWYYLGLNDRSPSWTGVSPFFVFLTTNHGSGPFGHVVSRKGLQPGDVIQLGKTDGTFYHSLFVLSASPAGIFVAAHSDNSLWRNLNTYSAPRLRMIHIDGFRA